jgi:hypothetical protein
MRAGSFDKQIVINRLNGAFSIDENGAIDLANSQGVPMRAALIETASTDVAADTGHKTQTVLKFKCHFLPDCKAGDRVTYDHGTYEILEVREIGRRKSLELKVIKRT